jgi:hypothetical protein
MHLCESVKGSLVGSSVQLNDLEVPRKAGSFLPHRAVVSFCRRTVFRGD